MASSNVPSPDFVHVLLVALPPLVPKRVYVLPEHIVASAPALAVAAAFIVSIIASVAAGHGPAGSSVVIVKVTVPIVISVAPGV